MARLQARVERAVVAGGRQLEMPTGIYHRHVLHCVLAPSPLHYKQLCAFLPASIPGGGTPVHNKAIEKGGIQMAGTRERGAAAPLPHVRACQRLRPAMLRRWPAVQ